VINMIDGGNETPRVTEEEPKEPVGSFGDFIASSLHYGPSSY